MFIVTDALFIKFEYEFYSKFVYVKQRIQEGCLKKSWYFKGYYQQLFFSVSSLLGTFLTSKVVQEPMHVSLLVSLVLRIQTEAC